MNAGLAIVAVNYRLAPKVQPPAFIQDAAAAVHWALDEIADYGGDPRFCLGPLGRYEEYAYMMRMMTVAGHLDTKLYELDGYGHSMIGPAFPLLVNYVREVSERIRGHLDPNGR